ncbi:MAG: ABC transporter permease [Deinococcus sp.]|nr:ABC transporter permease [Deinococcus sp.]
MRLKLGRELTILLLLIALVAYMGLTHRNYVHPRTVGNILTNAAYVSVVAVGMTLVIISGQIDISVGSVLAVCALVAGTLAKNGVPMLLVVLSSLVMGTLLGALNGTLVAYARIPSIIVTLGTLTILRGAVIWWTGGFWVQPLPPEWKFLGTTRLLGQPLPIWIALAVLIAASYLVANTPFGRQIYAVGSNARAARLAGINVPATHFRVLTLNGFLAGLAAMIHVTRFSQVFTNEGQDLEFLVITAVVVGGTNIFGGSGTILGSVLGVLFLGATSTALPFLRIDPLWDQAVRGAFILLSVAADIVRTGQWRRVIAGGAT